jgi:hypothetical protein
MDDVSPDETSGQSLGDIPEFEEWAAEVMRLLEARREAQFAPSEEMLRSFRPRRSRDNARPSEA